MYAVGVDTTMPVNKGVDGVTGHRMIFQCHFAAAAAEVL